MSMHIVFMVSKYIIYVLSDFRDQIPLRILVALPTFIHCLTIVDPTHSVVFLHMRRIQKLDVCSPILGEHIVFLSKNANIGYVLLI